MRRGEVSRAYEEWLTNAISSISSLHSQFVSDLELVDELASQWLNNPRQFILERLISKAKLSWIESNKRRREYKKNSETNRDLSFREINIEFSLKHDNSFNVWVLFTRY